MVSKNLQSLFICDIITGELHLEKGYFHYVSDTKPLNLKFVCSMHSKPNTETSVLGDGERFIQVGQNEEVRAYVLSNSP